MKDFGDVARAGTVTRQTSRLAKRLAEGTSTREEAIEILSHLIVDRLGREKATEVFNALDAYKEGTGSHQKLPPFNFWGPTKFK